MCAIVISCLMLYINDSESDCWKRSVTVVHKFPFPSVAFNAVYSTYCLLTKLVELTYWLSGH